MKKVFLLFAGIFLLGLSLKAAETPDNIYFRSMKDEMYRSLSQLYVKGSPKPYYLAYKLMHTSFYCAEATLGELQSGKEDVQHSLEALVVLAAGNPQNDSMGFVTDQFDYEPENLPVVPDSYWGIRHALWKLTDTSYIKATHAYEKKQAYKRQKNIPQNIPDFIPAPQASFLEEIKPFPYAVAAELDELAKKLSARGKDIPYLEDFSVRLCLSQTDHYFLNSNGGMYQFSMPNSGGGIFALLRNKEGYQQILSHPFDFPFNQQPNQPDLLRQTEMILQEAEQLFSAVKPEPYLGPVLLTPSAASDFIRELLISNLTNIKPLLRESADEDFSAGAFRNKTGMRIMSNVVDVYDRPRQRQYKGFPLAGFQPVDDEGVSAEELTVVSSGKLHQLPLSRRPVEPKQASNGHARMTINMLPREALSNVFVQPKKPLSEQELEAKLLERCRELELEYCYILKQFPSLGETVNVAQKIYTKDGRKESVFGIKIDERTTRSLRDILAAGQDEKVFSAYDYDGRTYAIITPSLLVDEIEILPDDKKADRAPFIPKP